MKLVFVILVITLFTMLCVSSVSPALIISSGSGTSDLSPTWANGQSTLYTDTDGASYEPVWVNGQSTLVVEEF